MTNPDFKSFWGNFPETSESPVKKRGRTVDLDKAKLTDYQLKVMMLSMFKPHPPEQPERLTWKEILDDRSVEGLFTFYGSSMLSVVRERHVVRRDLFLPRSRSRLIKHMEVLGDNSIAVVSDPNFDSYKSIFFVGISQQPGMLRDWVSRMVRAEGLDCEIRSYGGYRQKPKIW